MRIVSSAGRGFDTWATGVVESNRAANRVRIAKIDVMPRWQLAPTAYPQPHAVRVGARRDTAQVSAQKRGANLGHLIKDLHRYFRRRALVGAEAQLRCDASDPVELLIIADVHHKQPVPYGVADYGIAQVFELGVGLAAYDAVGSDVIVHVPAVIAFHAGRTEGRRDQQRLHLAALEGAQHPPQPDRAAPIAMRFANHLGDQRLLAFVVVLLQQLE